VKTSDDGVLKLESDNAGMLMSPPGNKEPKQSLELPIKLSNLSKDPDQTSGQSRPNGAHQEIMLNLTNTTNLDLALVQQTSLGRLESKEEITKATTISDTPQSLDLLGQKKFANMMFTKYNPFISKFKVGGQSLNPSNKKLSQKKNCIRVRSHTNFNSFNTTHQFIKNTTLNDGFYGKGLVSNTSADPMLSSSNRYLDVGLRV
jgi:hypothetical protein